MFIIGRLEKTDKQKEKLVLFDDKIATLVESRLFYSIHLSEAVWEK